MFINMNNLLTLTEKFQTTSEKNQLYLIEQIINEGENGWQFFRDFLQSCQGKQANLVLGKAYQLLYKTGENKNKQFLNSYFPQGIVSLKSEKNINYSELQKLLIEQNYQAADSLTRKKIM